MVIINLKTNSVAFDIKPSFWLPDEGLMPKHFFFLLTSYKFSLSQGSISLCLRVSENRGTGGIMFSGLPSVLWLLLHHVIKLSISHYMYCIIWAGQTWKLFDWFLNISLLLVWCFSTNFWIFSSVLSVVSAFYAECLSKKIQFNAHIWTKSKFLGMSIGVHNIGQGTRSTASYTPKSEFLHTSQSQLHNNVIINCGSCFRLCVMFGTRWTLHPHLP